MIKHIMTMMAVAVAVTGCTGSEVRNTLGLSRRSPDAFSVVSRPPLSVPKEFQLVEPGADQGAGDTGISADKTAKALLLGDTQAAASDAQNADDGLAGQMREQVGAKPSDEDVRTQMNQETWDKEQNQKDKSVMDILQSGFTGDEADVLDAEKEAQRLKDAK